MPKLLAVFACTVALWLVLPLSASTQPAGSISVCAHFKGHLYEACFAYVFNDSALALRGYYADPSKTGDALEGFLYRYRAQARSLIAGRVAGWPPGRNTVGLPKITILKASSSLVTNTAQLTTQETWRVTDSSGNLVYAENNRLHQISMARVQGKLLHIWVVTAIR